MNDQADNPAAEIIETSAETFEQDVFARSHEVPVVVDFWAPWCAPCRALGPVLEQLAAAYVGQFTLVKANTDELPEAAAMFGVQGIPAVYGVIEGEVVDFFAGALPEAQIRSWLDRLVSVSSLVAARRLEEADPAAAEAKYRELAAQTPDDPAVQIGLARALVAQEKLDESRAIIAHLEERGFLEPEAEKVKATLDLRGMKNDNRLAETRAAATARPDDLPLQLQLAESLAGGQQYQEALEICLSLVQRDRPGVGEKARQLMIEIFRALPDDSELTSTYRRKLSMALY